MRVSPKSRTVTGAVWRHEWFLMTVPQRIPTGTERIPIAADECGRKVRRLEVPDKLLSRLVWLERGDEARCGRDYTSAYRFHPFERRRRCGAPRRRGDVHRRRQQRGT